MPLPGTLRVLLFVTVSSLLRQPVAVSAQAQPDCSAPALEVLAATRGSWEVAWRDRLAPGRYDTTRAHATIEPTARGCGLLERFEGTKEGRPFAALTLIGPSAGDSLQRIWQDSEHGTLLVFGAAAAGRPLRFEWHRRLDGRVLRLRHTYLSVTTDSFVTVTELSPDSGRSWDVVTELIYRRKRS